LPEQQDRHQQQQEEEEEEEVAGMVNESPKKNGMSKALIIGISKYDHNNKFSNLDFCENNANEIYSILEAQGYKVPANALLVGRVEWTRMRDEIIDFFEDSTLKPDDTLFFYFSGHGLIDKNTDRTYLSTSEIDPASPKKRGIPFEDLTTYINDSNSERIIAVLDCCYSNALAIAGKDGGGGGKSAKAEKDEEMADSANTNMRKAVEHLIRSGQGKCVLASSLEEQRSFKMKDQPYSTFTYFLIQGLKGANGESVDINGYVTLELLSSYVNKKMYELPTIKQKPIRKIEVTGQIILAHYPSLARGQQQTSQKSSSHLIQLLRKGKIDEFNEIRKKDNYSRLDFCNVDLSGLSLSHADLRKSNLISANLAESKLQHATFEETALLGAHLEGADVSKADVSKADLVEADLEGTNLEGADVSKADLSEANLSLANLSKANLEGADVSKADLVEADVSKADLVEANLSNADLVEANLVGANLSKADLSNADLSEANLSNADLVEANLASSIIIGAKFLVKNNKKCYPRFKNAEFNDSTIIDDEELWRHVCNNNAKNVQPAVKNTKELREKLEQRGFDTETIDWLLSFSSLPDPSS
jgi:uncharacterized protein YjbI with pentapeptide repeats